jgi:hypothetical protein
VEFIPTEFVTFARKILFVLPVIVSGLLLDAKAQDSPPKIDSFEETVPAGANQTAPQFRMTYPVRDASSGQTFTEQKPSTAQDVPTAVSEADMAAGLTMPDPGPVPAQSQPQPMSQADASAALDTVGTADSYRQELPVDEPFRSGRGPFRYSFYLQEGYNSNVNAQKNGGVQSMFTSIGASASYAFGTSRMQVEMGLGAGLTFYYNNAGLQNNGLFPNGDFDLNIEYAASEKLNFFLNHNTALLAQPDFALVGASNTYQGDYLVSATTLGVSYQWLPKFQTITTYTPVFWAYFEPIGDNFSRFEQTVAQQFLYLWKPTTSLVAEYRFNTRNYFAIDNYNSIGNYALLGFNHQLNPRSELVFRGGAEQRINQIPVTGGTYNYIGPFGELNFSYSLRPETQLSLLSRYGTVASGINDYNQDQQFRIGTTLSHVFGRRLTANAFFFYQHNYYDQPDNGTPDFYTNVYNTGLSAAYAINRVWSINAGYSYTGLLSSNDNQQNSYNQNIIFLGTALNF